jgi:hypothetical protein
MLISMPNCPKTRLNRRLVPAVDVVAEDDVVARLEQVDDGARRGDARREGEPVVRVLERGDVVLERGARGVGPAGVVVVLDELARRLLDEGGGLVDGRHDRAGRGVGRLPGVDGAGVELEGAVAVHGVWL